MSDTTSENAQASEGADFLKPAIDAARDAGVPEAFDDSTSVFLHRTAAGAGYVLVAFDPAVLVRWADTKQGFRLLKGSLNFLPFGMPVLSIELEDIDAVEDGENEEGDQQ